MVRVQEQLVSQKIRRTNVCRDPILPSGSSGDGHHREKAPLLGKPPLHWHLLVESGEDKRQNMELVVPALPCVASVHTSYLSFLLHRQDFRKPNFTPKKRLKAPKTLKMSLKKSNICIFFHSIWKNLHLTENFYTDMSVVSVTNMRYAHHTTS